MNIPVRFQPDPFAEEVCSFLEEPMSITDMLVMVDAPSWFYDYGVVLVNGEPVPRHLWSMVKPKLGTEIRLHVIPQNKSVLAITASLALVAATAGIGTFGLPFLGAAFAAGSAGAAAAAAAVGIAGSLAISALTAPTVSKASSADQRNPLSEAGITSNLVTRYTTLPGILGRIRFSPPSLIESYTTYDKEELTLHAIVGLEGRLKTEKIEVNGIDIDELEGCTYEVREGAPGDDPLTLCQEICIQQNAQLTLTNFRTKLEANKNDQLENQDTPDESLPDHHILLTDGTVEEIRIRFLFPSGIVNTSDGSEAAVPIRIRIRKKGAAAWRNLPTMHVFDIKKGNGPFRVEAKLKFQKHPPGRLFSNATNEWPIFELTNDTGLGQSFEYLSDAYFRETSWPVADLLPTMTSATTSGVTFSASSELGASQAAWKAHDNDVLTGWQPANNSLPAWLKIDFGSATTVRCYRLIVVEADNAVSTLIPTVWYVEGSNDNTNWTRLDSTDIDISEIPLNTGTYQIENAGSYRYYRWNFSANNGAANQQIRIRHMSCYSLEAPGLALGVDSSSFHGMITQHTSTSDPRCMNAGLDENGATFYLDPAEWEAGEYEVDFQRGSAFTESGFSPLNYSYNAVTANSDFFDYRVSSGSYVIRVGQRNYRSDTVVEVFSSVEYASPVDTTGIACIAVEIKGFPVASISAVYTSYASRYDYYGDMWNFQGTDHDWTGSNCTLIAGNEYLTIDNTSGDASITSPDDLNIDGQKHWIVEMEIKRVSGSTWEGTLFYVSSAHTMFSSGETVAEPTWGSDWSLLTWDLSVDTGANDWTQAGVPITQLRFDLSSSSSSNDDFQIRSIRIRRASTALAVWSDSQHPTDNNAALFRSVLLGYGNPIPFPGEIIDEEELIDWYGRCITQRYRVNAVIQDRSIADVLNLIAYCAKATPRDSEYVGVVQDYDRSAEVVMEPISPLNSQSLGQVLEKPLLPDALHVQFNDEMEDYAVKRVVVYRQGFSDSTARIFDTITYEGITNEVEARARAAFDLLQLEHRSVQYNYRVGKSGYLLRKGTLVKLTDDVIDKHVGYGFIQDYTLSGANITSIILETRFPFAAVQEDAEMYEDMGDTSVQMSVCISLSDGTSLFKDITEVADSNICTFSTPFDFVASGIEKGDFVAIGAAGKEVRRCYVANVEAVSLEEKIVTLKDCAYEELFQ